MVFLRDNTPSDKLKALSKRSYQETARSFKESGYQRGRRSFTPGSCPTIWPLWRFLHFDPFSRFAPRIVDKLYFDRVTDFAIGQCSL